MKGSLLRKAGVLEDETDLEMLTLDMICLSLYGPEYIAWESETLKEELQDDLGEIGVVAWEKIQAARLLHANDSAWKEWEVFEKVCAAANGHLPIFSHAQPPDPEDMAIALDVMARIDTHDFHEDVTGYIAAACLNDGSWYLEGPLRVAEKSMGWYINNKGISVDRSSVDRALDGRATLYKTFENASEIQANKAMVVRKSLEIYNKKLKEELAMYKNLIGGRF